MPGISGVWDCHFWPITSNHDGQSAVDAAMAACEAKKRMMLDRNMLAVLSKREEGDGPLLESKLTLWPLYMKRQLA